MSKLQAGYVLHADSKWLSFHSSNSVNMNVVYLRGLGAPMKNVLPGGIILLLQRGSSPRSIYGWARFIADEPIGFSRAWEQYGNALGVANEDDWTQLISSLPGTRDKSEIRLIHLGGFQALPSPIPLASIGIKDISYATKGYSIDSSDVEKFLNAIGESFNAENERDIEPEFSPEGLRKLSLHRWIERNQRLVIAAKNRWRAQDPLLRCSVCSFSFKEQFGVEHIEAHHISPLGELPEFSQVTTSIEDLAPVCPTCHRALHLLRCSIEELQNYVK